MAPSAFVRGCVLFAAASVTAAGQVTLTYIPGSSVKIEQVIGDCDWQVQALKGTCQPTASQTVKRFNILGNGQGNAFESKGKMIVLFGDTISKDVAAVNYHAADPIAWSTSTDPEAGLLLNFYTNADGSPLFVKPPGIPMGPDALPNAGIAINGQIYLICNIGSDTSLADPQSVDTSVLVTFNEAAQTFAGGRAISPVGGHFINAALRQFGSNVFMFGAGPYRKSSVYLAMTPAATFASGAGTQYFAGLVNGQPTWANAESGAVPVVADQPIPAPAGGCTPWQTGCPSVGNLSIAYSNDLKLWLMTYDGGRQSNATRGTYFSYAAQPWGPWAKPQLIFNDARDKAYGTGGFIHNPNIVPDPPGDGLNGPTIGSNDIYTTAGGAFAPLMIERFITVAGTTLKVYYNVSTWNPYTIVRMRSQFTIASSPLISLVANAEGEDPTIGPNTWVEIKGANLAPAGDARIWDAPDFVKGQLPTQLDGVSVSVDGKPAYVYYISPGQVNILTPPDMGSGAVNVVVTGGSGSASFTAQARAEAPSFFVFNGGPYAAATHANGSYIGPSSLYPGLTTPAKPGETVVLYANGLGPTSVPVVSGSPTQAGTLPVAPVIRIGGVGAAVQFAGLVAPGQFQLNVVVPAGTPDGDNTLTATHNGIATQTGVLLSVQH